MEIGYYQMVQISRLGISIAASISKKKSSVAELIIIPSVVYMEIEVALLKH
jgi:hypothetical protein